MADEYYERKVRYYQPKKKEDGGKMAKFIFNPMKKMVGMDKKKNQVVRNPEKERLFA